MGGKGLGARTNHLCCVRNRETRGQGGWSVLSSEEKGTQGAWTHRGDMHGLVSRVISGPYLRSHGKTLKGFQWEDVSHSCLRSLSRVLRMCWREGGENSGVKKRGESQMMASCLPRGPGGGNCELLGKHMRHILRRGGCGTRDHFSFSDDGLKLPESKSRR